jgi:DNA processing protein
LTDAERRARLRLARTERVGPVAFDQLMQRFGSAQAALERLPELARRGGGELTPVPASAVNAEIEAGEALGAKLLVLGDVGFPARLFALDPPPPVLWTLGRQELLARDSVAIVGARIASAAGQRFARGLASELSTAGYVVVSGLARGIDAAAHEGSLERGTVAVLGGGVDDIYPPEHAELHARVAERGCVVSESPVGARAQARDFPRRNRIISGLALGVVVVEAELRSGSLITARLAAEQGREVFAVPGSPLDPRARGTNDLLRQGATVCEGADDVIRVLSAPSLIREPEAEPYGVGADPGLDAAAEAVRRRVEALLSPVPTPRDEIVRTAGAPAPVVLAALVELALAGKAELLAGGLVCRTT